MCVSGVFVSSTLRKSPVVGSVDVFPDGRLQFTAFDSTLHTPQPHPHTNPPHFAIAKSTGCWMLSRWMHKVNQVSLFFPFWLLIASRNDSTSISWVLLPFFKAASTLIRSYLRELIAFRYSRQRGPSGVSLLITFIWMAERGRQNPDQQTFTFLYPDWPCERFATRSPRG